jgi:predicted transcriptional regulator
MHATLAELATGSATAPEQDVVAESFTPAVSARRSLASKDHIISLIDGKPYKTLTRHLSSNGLTPKEYRARYNLRSDYPMVSENYSQSRREMAKRIGLGRRTASSLPVEDVAAAPVATTKKAATSGTRSSSKTISKSVAPKPRTAKKAPSANTDTTDKSA